MTVLNFGYCRVHCITIFSTYVAPVSLRQKMRLYEAKGCITEDLTFKRHIMCHSSHRIFFFFFFLAHSVCSDILDSGNSVKEDSVCVELIF